MFRDGGGSRGNCPGSGWFRCSLWSLWSCDLCVRYRRETSPLNASKERDKPDFLICNQGWDFRWIYTITRTNTNYGITDFYQYHDPQSKSARIHKSGLIGNINSQPITEARGFYTGQWACIIAWPSCYWRFNSRRIYIYITAASKQVWRRRQSRKWNRRRNGRIHV